MVNSHKPMGACHDAGSYILNQNQKEGGRLAETLYFAYGSNMNLDQMDFRCPAAEVVEMSGWMITALLSAARILKAAWQQSCRKRAAMWMAFYGGSPGRVKRA